MLGESKYKIHKILPQDLVPVTVLLKRGSTFVQVKNILRENDLRYPVILKPDIGERGWMVAKIVNDEELKLYLSNIPVDFLAQEYIDLPLELGVFYYRYPGQDKGKITSIVQKKMLTVKGTGKDSIYDLMQADPRARLQIRTFLHDNPELLKTIPKEDELVELMPIGNHIRGTAFLNANRLINVQLNHVFDNLCKKIDGFYFGRFDIRCRSTVDLYKGKILIMELNGAGAEPGHIYHPGSSLFDAYKAIIYHLRILFEISRENKKKGVPFMKFGEGITWIKEVRSYNKLKSTPKSVLA